MLLFKRKRYKQQKPNKKGIGFCGGLTIVLLLLKLCGANIPWIVVFVPLIISVLGIYILAFILAVILSIFDFIAEKVSKLYRRATASFKEKREIKKAEKLERERTERLIKQRERAARRYEKENLESEGWII